MRMLCEACGAVTEARRVARPGAEALACAACGAEALLPPGPPPAPPPASAEAGTDPAWDELRARWHDEEAHRRFIDGHAGLEGLARAGARYREVLATRPDDEAARRGRDEVLRRATALGLAALPRSTPPPPSSGRLKWLVVAVLGAAALGAAAWTLSLALRSGAAR